MPLLNIAKKNMRQNMKNYALYLFSMIFTVTVYLTFRTIGDSEMVSAMLQADSKIGDAFKGAAIVIAMFSAVFIWYSNNFFLKKRKKEIGLYALLGIENKSIGKLLFYETLMLGFVALIVGIFAGMVFSSLALAILSKVTIGKYVFKFIFSMKSILNTAGVFFVLHVLVSMNSRSIIYNNTLLQLFKAESQAEKQPKVSKVKGLLAISLIVLGYINYLVMVKVDLAIATLGTLILVITGTYLFFSSFLLYYIKGKKNKDNILYKGMNIISINQLLYRTKGNSRSLATIAILTATTLTAMGAVVATNIEFKSSISKDSPYSYATSLENEEAKKGIEKIISKYDENKLLYTLHIATKEVKRGKSASSDFQSKRIGHSTVISESQFNRILEKNDYNETFKTLSKNNDAIRLLAFMQDADESTENIYLEGKSGIEEINIVGTYNRSLVYLAVTMDTVVVKDSMYELLKAEEYDNYTVYDVENKKESAKLTAELAEFTNGFNEVKKYPLLSFYERYSEQSLVSGMMMFIGVFLGLIFLVCTGSIIFFKQVSEAQEEIHRYKILRNIGVEEHEIKSSIYKQVSSVFIMPIVIALMHSVVAVSVLAKMLHQNLTVVMIITCIPYLIIYGIYYLVTAKYYYKIIK